MSVSDGEFCEPDQVCMPEWAIRSSVCSPAFDSGEIPDFCKDSVYTIRRRLSKTSDVDVLDVDSLASLPISSSPANTFSRVLVIHSGGTIGMTHLRGRGYTTSPGFLFSHLSKNSNFNDPAFHFNPINDTTDDEDENVVGELMGMNHVGVSSLGPVLAMPVSIFGRRVIYQMLEYDPLIDSCNAHNGDWIRLASDIEKYYHLFDAFVILHGTDTMAYTTSALSFLLADLGKSVIFTGSQIPFSEVRNDASQNLLGALTIAGHYVIPEVTLFFGTRLMRGNRVSKMDSSSFDAFDAPTQIARNNKLRKRRLLEGKCAPAEAKYLTIMF